MRWRGVATNYVFYCDGQSIVRAKISNKPVQTVGLCHGGRRITTLGVLVANTVTSVDNQCARLVVTNTTDEPTILYPGTKLGTFTLVESEKVVPFPNLNKEIDDEIHVMMILDFKKYCLKCL